MIRFIEVLNQTDFNPRMERTATPRFSLSEVWINEKYVVNVKEAVGYQSLLREGLLPSELDSQHQFTTITINQGNVAETHVVVGSPTSVANRLRKEHSNLLKG